MKLVCAGFAGRPPGRDSSAGLAHYRRLGRRRSGRAVLGRVAAEFGDSERHRPTLVERAPRRASRGPHASRLPSERRASHHLQQPCSAAATSFAHSHPYQHMCSPAFATRTSVFIRTGCTTDIPRPLASAAPAFASLLSVTSRGAQSETSYLLAQCLRDTCSRGECAKGGTASAPESQGRCRFGASCACLASVVVVVSPATQRGLPHGTQSWRHWQQVDRGI